MSSCPPKRRRVLDQRTSIGWFDLPSKIRKIVTDKMDETTRCTFAQCSKMCEEEAKKSDKCLNKIYVSEHQWTTGDELKLHLGYTEKDDYDFCFEFLDTGENQTTVVYNYNTASKVVSKWTTTESGKRRDVRMKYFNEYVEQCENGIKSLYIHDYEIPLREYNIPLLENLEELDITTSGDFQEFIKNGTLDFDQLMSLKCFEMENAELTFDEIIQFQGETMVVSSDDMNQSKVEEYLKMIKRREIFENFKMIRVFLRCSIDFDYLMKELRGFDFRENMWAREDGQTFSVEYEPYVDFEVTYDGNMIQIEQ